MDAERDDTLHQPAPPPALPASGWLLAIDSSSDLVSVALVPFGEGTPGGAELAWPAARNQTATLLSQIDHLTKCCGIEPSALSAVAVATGPGGFNALRVGMSVAKGFAFALGLPLAGVGTLAVAAHPFARLGLPVRAFVPAGRGRVVFADFPVRGGRLQHHGEMNHRRPADLAADLLQPTVVTGDLSEADEAALRDHPHVILPDAGLRRRRAGWLADIALAKLRAGEADDLTTLEPIYVHQQQHQPDTPAAAGHRGRQDGGFVS